MDYPQCSYSSLSLSLCLFPCLSRMGLLSFRRLPLPVSAIHKKKLGTAYYSGPPFLPMSDLWMWGMTPPPAMVALIKLSSSSSPRMASCRCLGVIRFTLRSFEALPANSSTWVHTTTAYDEQGRIKLKEEKKEKAFIE